MELTAADIRLILTALQESDYDEAEVVVGDVRIAVARNGGRLPGSDPAPTPSVVTPQAGPSADDVAAPAPDPERAAPEATASGATAAGTTAPKPDSGDTVVTAPTVGVFWRAPEPGAAPFVEVGSQVAVGDTVGIVEVMKLMSNVVAEVAGVVTAVHAENASGVQFGTPLVSIRADG